MKDAQGHGSAPRFGDYAKSKLGEKYIIARPTPNNVSRYPGYNFVTAGQHEAVKADYRRDHPDAANAYFGADNSSAARGLASGPKSAAAPVHNSMGYNEHGSRHGYSPDAVNNAIAAQNRSGRGKIGGKEARAIHALLKGR